MVKMLSFNSRIAVTIHKHNNLILVWDRANFKVAQENLDQRRSWYTLLESLIILQIIQEIHCFGIENQDEVSPLFVRATETFVVAWMEDGAIVVFSIFKDGTLRRKKVLNGHIQGKFDGGSCIKATFQTSISSLLQATWTPHWTGTPSSARLQTAR